mmetsp:Transcript_89762/g.231744  ORF Transcript_89762/g.231744 Transcript_89762/m.231744 type:complete len:187 (+) Transcript_89762:142-702(+)
MLGLVPAALDVEEAKLALDAMEDAEAKDHACGTWTLFCKSVWNARPRLCSLPAGLVSLNAITCTLGLKPTALRLTGSALDMNDCARLPIEAALAKLRLAGKAESSTAARLCMPCGEPRAWKLSCLGVNALSGTRPETLPKIPKFWSSGELLPADGTGEEGSYVVLREDSKLLLAATPLCLGGLPTS